MERQDCDAYWRRVHATSADDLGAVCFPDKPRYFNLFFDRAQRFAVGEFLRREGVQVAGWRWLDLGCGRGRWLQYFSQLGARTSGIDIAAAAVGHCSRFGFPVEQASVDSLPFGSGVFRAASSITVLMHVAPPQRRGAIGEISRVLAPGGLALLVEATRDSDAPHVYSMSVGEWEAAFAAHGLRLIHVSAHCFGLWRRWLPARLPCRDRMSIYLDYPLELAIMRACYGKRSDLGWQHLMIFRKGCPA